MRWFPLLLPLALLVPRIGPCRGSAANLLRRAAVRGRRWLNFGGAFGSAARSDTVYDRVAGHPVFAVTTPWGSPYMNMERLSDLEETIPETAAASKTPASLSEEQNEVRMVALYFLDPADALAMHGEMKQMENMGGADVRLTGFSLAKAVRQASVLGRGLTTGQPPEPTTGRLTDGGTLRYKLVPPKRQLYYAARCRGRERVGLCGETAGEDAALAVTGNSALEAANLLRRRQRAERKLPAGGGGKRTGRSAAAVPHMEGYTGIPVFYSPSLHRRPPLLKRWLTRVPQEKPFFFNYEDLVAAWEQMKGRQAKSAAAAVPDQPVDVEVFNLWDVLSSMDRQQPAKTNNPLVELKRRFSSVDGDGLQDITFVPNSDAVHYKDAISRRGNGKARLRPMR